MPADKFWQIIERAAKSDHDPDAQMKTLRTALHELSIEEIISFEVAFRRYLNEAYTWDLWGAADLIHGGCSDDGFEYFRRWLVSRGRDVYEAALADPDSLAQRDLQPGPDGVWEFEEIYYVAREVFEEKGGEGDVRDYSEPEAGMAGPGPSGERFGDDDQHLARRYPKLWQRFSRARAGVLEVRLEDRSSERRKVLPFHRVETNPVIAEVGGPIDEVNVTLALYSEELEPEEISRALGVEPTHAHRRGDHRRGESPGSGIPPYSSGAWLLKEHGRDAEPAEAVIDRLLKQLPEDPAVWRDLSTRHDIQFRFGLHMTGWNKGLSIPLNQVTRIAELRASMEFDIYAYGEDG